MGVTLPGVLGGAFLFNEIPDMSWVKMSLESLLALAL